jgi:hypothetical protein
VVMGAHQRRFGLLLPRAGELNAMIRPPETLNYPQPIGPDLGLAPNSTPQLEPPKRLPTMKKALLCRAFREWRDPDSNRGHHDFQTTVRRFRFGRKSLLTTRLQSSALACVKSANCMNWLAMWATRCGSWPNGFACVVAGEWSRSSALAPAKRGPACHAMPDAPRRSGKYALWRSRQERGSSSRRARAGRCR